MIIIVDHNNDRVDVNIDDKIIRYERIRDMTKIQSILEEVINEIAAKVPSQSLDVTLESMNEDRHTNIGDW